MINSWSGNWKCFLLKRVALLMLLLTGYKGKGKDEESDKETDEDVAELDKDKNIEGLEDLSKSKTLPAEAKDVLNDLKMDISGNH